MPSLKDVKVQIVGVKKTKQITKAMNMVASSKLRGAQTRIEQFRPYADKFGELLHELSARASEATHPLLEVHDEKKNIVILLMTSDKGLCGAFNMNVITSALKFAAKQQAEGKNVQFIAVGKKARDAVSKAGYTILHAFVDVLNNFNFSLASRIGEELIRAYSAKEIDEVHIYYGLFVHVARQVPANILLLPVVPSENTNEKEDAKKENSTENSTGDYLYEPSEAEILTEILPKYVNCQVYRALLDTSASENAARMTAMDNATRNCDDMINSLTLLYNKTRQAAITAELIDIVGGVEALNG